MAKLEREVTPKWGPILPLRCGVKRIRKGQTWGKLPILLYEYPNVMINLTLNNSPIAVSVVRVCTWFYGFRLASPARWNGKLYWVVS